MRLREVGGPSAKFDIAFRLCRVKRDGGVSRRFTLEMRVAGGRLDLGVAEQSSDHGEVLAKLERIRGEGVTQVVNAQVVKARALA